MAKITLTLIARKLARTPSFFLGKKKLFGIRWGFFRNDLRVNLMLPIGVL